MVSTRQKKQSKRKHLSQLDDFDKDSIIGDAANGRQQNAVVNDDTVDREFAGINSGGKSIANENTLNVQTLERCLIERIDKKMGRIVDTVENGIQNGPDRG